VFIYDTGCSYLRHGQPPGGQGLDAPQTIRFSIPPLQIGAVPRVHIRHKIILIACAPHQHVSARECATVEQVPLANAILEEEREEQLGDVRITEQSAMG